MLKPPVDWSSDDPEHRRKLAQSVGEIIDEVAELLGRQLGQARPANTTAVSIYSPGTGLVGKITEIVVCNTTAAAAKFRIFMDDDGTTYDETTAHFFDVNVPANTTSHPMDRGSVIWMEDATGNLAVRTDTNNALTFTVYGSEIPITRP